MYPDNGYYPPINNQQKQLIQDLLDHNIETNLTTLWQQGGSHHDPRSRKVIEGMADLDWLLATDSMCIKTGGDGDNGETMMYLLDVFFRLLDAKGEQL